MPSPTHILVNPVAVYALSNLRPQRACVGVTADFKVVHDFTTGQSYPEWNRDGFFPLTGEATTILPVPA